MPLDVSKYLDIKEKEIQTSQVDVKPLFITLYVFLAASSILGIILHLFDVFSIEGVWRSLLFNGGSCLVAFLAYFFKKRCLLWFLFLVNIFNIFNLITMFVYAIPAFIIIITIYRNMGKNYRYFINKHVENKILNVLLVVFTILLHGITFAWLCYYSYFEWNIIREAFWQFFNPFSYIWAFGLMFKSVNTYIFANITIVIGCLSSCILLSQKLNKERQNKEEPQTTTKVKSTKMNFLRFLKYKYLKYKKYQRKQRKIKNEKQERKEVTKHRGRFVLSKDLTFIIIALIVALSYVFVEQNKINYKEKIRQEEELSEKIQQEAYESCMKEVESDYLYNWNKACKRLNKKTDCSLPAYNADSIEKWRKEAKTTCLDKLKNKAFKEYEIEE